MKNLVICCDGTANEFAKHNTNVVKLFSTLDADSSQQISYYHPGLGTMEPAGALTPVARKITKLFGMAFGYGLESDIRDAYIFLMNNFESNDRVFMFGFSRGAYTVRAVASLLHMYGLIRKGNDALVSYAIRMLTAIDRDGSDTSVGAVDRSETIPSPVRGYFQLAEQFEETFSIAECKPHFVGVWDTVSSVGWIENFLKLPYTADNPDIAIGRQAVAIDERRAFFRQNLWWPKHPPPESGPRDLKQVWFPGVHCDVGGGYSEEESGLSKLSLEWMISEALQHGLLCDQNKVDSILGRGPGAKYVKPDPNAQIHNSLTGWWRLAEFVPKPHFDSKTRTTTRRMNLFRSRTIPAGSSIHESAYQRGGAYSQKLPSNAVQVKTDCSAFRRNEQRTNILPAGEIRSLLECKG
jgi:uncharacterized protein (DUF2235 family)